MNGKVVDSFNENYVELIQSYAPFSKFFYTNYRESELL